MKSITVEMSCDYCERSEQYLNEKTTDLAMRAKGWVFSEDKRSFCDQLCWREYRVNLLVNGRRD